MPQASSHVSPILAQAQAVASSTVDTVAHLSADILMFIGLVVLVTGYIVWRGKDEGIASVLALVIAGFVLTSLSFLDARIAALGASGAFGIKLLALLVAFFLARAILARSIMSSYPGSTIARWGGAFFLALAAAALLFVYGARFLGVEDLYVFSPFITSVLALPYTLAAAIGAALAILLILSW